MVLARLTCPHFSISAARKRRTWSGLPATMSQPRGLDPFLHRPFVQHRGQRRVHAVQDRRWRPRAAEEDPPGRRLESAEPLLGEGADPLHMP